MVQYEAYEQSRGACWSTYGFGMEHDQMLSRMSDDRVQSVSGTLNGRSLSSKWGRTLSLFMSSSKQFGLVSFALVASNEFKR